MKKYKAMFEVNLHAIVFYSHCSSTYKIELLAHQPIESEILWKQLYHDRKMGTSLQEKRMGEKKRGGGGGGEKNKELIKKKRRNKYHIIRHALNIAIQYW